MNDDVTTLLELIRSMNDPVGWNFQDQIDACAVCGSTATYGDSEDRSFPHFDHYRSCEFGEIKDFAQRLLRCQGRRDSKVMEQGSAQALA